MSTKIKSISIKAIVCYILLAVVLFSVGCSSDPKTTEFFSKPLTDLTVGDLCFILFIIGLITGGRG